MSERRNIRKNDPNVLAHKKKFKYVDRVWKNGRWQYTYADDIKTENHRKTIESYQKHGNKYSRNMPGSSATEANTGKQMTRLQRAQAIAKGTGNTREWDKITDQHASKLWGREHLRKTEYNKDVSRNIPGMESADGGAHRRSPAVTEPKKTTKKQIVQGLVRAKVKTLKRDAAKAIERAKKWFEDLFD